MTGTRVRKPKESSNGRARHSQEQTLPVQRCEARETGWLEAGHLLEYPEEVERATREFAPEHIAKALAENVGQIYGEERKVFDAMASLARICYLGRSVALANRFQELLDRLLDERWETRVNWQPTAIGVAANYRTGAADGNRLGARSKPIRNRQ